MIAASSNSSLPGNNTKPVISLIKLSSQVRKVIKELSITENTDTNLSAIVNTLLNTYPDYQSLTNQEFTQSVRGLFQNIIPSSPAAPESITDFNRATSGSETPKSSSKETKSMNLNQSIVNSQRSLASKRHRPDEPGSATLTQNDSSISLSKLNGSADNSTDKRMEARDKRRKPTTAENDGTSLNFPQSTGKINKVPNSFLVDRPKTRFSDLAGLDNVLSQIRELVCYPLWYSGLYTHLGVCPPCGILLHGPSGCGKTTLANAIAGETGLNYFKVSGPELIGGTSGESEERIRNVFETAAANAPSILFIDALDVIAGKKESTTRGMDRRIIAQLFDSIDYISSLNQITSSLDTSDLTSPYPMQRTLSSSSTNGNNNNISSETSQQKLVILMVATNKPEHIDPGVRGRFAKEIALPVPDAIARTKILQLHTTGMNYAPNIDFNLLGKMTPGYVGSDLQALAREAGMIAVTRIIHSQEATQPVPSLSIEKNEDGAMEITVSEEDQSFQNESSHLIDTNSTLTAPQLSQLDYADVYVEMKDFLQGIKQIQPTAKREGFAVAPEVSWNDIGALAEVREELKHNLLEPIAHPERFKALGLEMPAGVLFFGPPGCGKTLLAKAIANESGANFISVKGPELLNMYVGESESRVRQVFARARASAPCVIFFDEFDALCPKRSSGFDGSGGGSSGNGVSERVVNQLLTELDGLESRKDLYIIAATNRLELIDDAMLRPGRLGNLLYVPLPTASDRVSILSALTRKVSINLFSEQNPDGVQLEQVGSDERAEGFSGADLSALVREAGLSVIKEISATSDHFSSLTEKEGFVGDISRIAIQPRHFEQAFQKVKPSVNRKDRVRYEKLKNYLRNGLSAIEAVKAAYEDVRLLD